MKEDMMNERELSEEHLHTITGGCANCTMPGEAMQKASEAFNKWTAEAKQLTEAGQTQEAARAQNIALGHLRTIEHSQGAINAYHPEYFGIAKK